MTDMVLGVQAANVEYVNGEPQEKKINLNTPNDSFEKSKAKESDKANNGKFDATECIKNFAKGVLSPLTAVVKHPFVTAAVVGATAAACTLVPVLGPITAIGFGALSVFQLGKGVYNVAKNYNNGEYDKAEKSFEQVGQGTIGTVMSFIGIKQGAKVAKEAKLMDELQTATLSLEQKAKIASEIDNGTRLGALKETASLFTSKAGLKAVAAQFKPSNIALRAKDAINSLQALRGFKYTEEGKRRAALSSEEIEQEVTRLHKEVFDEYNIPEELRPKIQVVNEPANKGGGYLSTTHTIKINEKAYREGVFDLPDVMKHEATHTQRALLRSTLPEDTRNELVKEYLLSKINGGDNNTVMYENGFLGSSTMTPPKLNPQMQKDFAGFVSSEIYGKNVNYSAEQLADMVRPFVESNSEFCSAYNSADDAVKAVAQYAQSHQLRYNIYTRTLKANVDPDLLKTLQNVDVNEAKAVFIDSIECLDGNGANNTICQRLGFGGGDFNQYQFGAEEVLAQQKGNQFEISKLQAELEQLRSTANYDKNRETYLLNRIETAKGTIRYKTIGREYYKLLQESARNPENKELAAQVKAMKKEVSYLQNKTGPQMVRTSNDEIKVIAPYVLDASKDVPINSVAAADIIAEDEEENN